MPAIKQVVLVGHCGPDSGSLRFAVGAAVGNVPLHEADDSQSLDRFATPDALLLVNRVLDGGFDTASGIDLIGRLAKLPHPPQMMLVSNYADAQEQAVAAGARPGFGKAQAHSAATAELLRAAVQGEEPAQNRDSNAQR